MEQTNKRLQRARLDAGYPTPTEAARAFGWTVPTYLAHENGTRGISRDAATRYSRAFKVSLSWLLTGEGGGKNLARVPVTGYVGAGGDVFPRDDKIMQDVPAWVDPPPGANPDTCALVVVGNAMWPAYKNGDTVYYSERVRQPDTLLGSECVICLPDGRKTVRVIERGSLPSTYDLHSHNTPPIRDVEIEWASAIDWVRKSR